MDEQNPEAVAGKFTIKGSGTEAKYSDGVKRDSSKGKPKFSLMWPEGIPYEEQLMYRVAMHYARGGELYGDRNWEKSCTEEALAHHIDATERHLHKFLRGVEDGEDHAAAVVWGINAVLLARRNLRIKHVNSLILGDAAAVAEDDIDDGGFPVAPKEEIEAAKAKAGTFDYSGTLEKIRAAAEQAGSLAEFLKANPTAMPFEFTGEEVRPVIRPNCPDGGTCHHQCKAGPCFRVLTCEPLSGVFPDDKWPIDIYQAHQVLRNLTGDSWD